MKAQKSILTSLIITILCAFALPAHAEKITHIYSSPLPPVSMPAGNSGTGIAYKAVEEIMRRAEVNIPITFGDWDIVYDKTLNDNGAAVFPIVMSSDRRKDFYWVGPIASLDYFIYKPRGSNIKVNDLDDIRNAKKIATVKDYAVNQTLKDSGCQNLVYFDTAEQAINSLLNGDTSIGIFPDATVKGFLKNMGKKNSRGLTPIHMFMKRNLYYALNKNTSPRVALYMQKILLDMNHDGTLSNLYKQYMPQGRKPKIPEFPIFPDETILPANLVFSEPLIINGKAVPTIKSNVVERRTTSSVVLSKDGKVMSGNKKEVITIYAEEFPPFTFSTNNSNYIQGAAAELVSAIQKELGQIPAPIQILEWNSIIYLAQSAPFTAICTLKRTADRENEFYWIGPYAADSAWLYARRDATIHLNNIAEAKLLPVIACVGGAFAGSTLSNKGFSNLMPYSTPKEVMQDIMQNPGHAAALSSISAPFIARDAGYSAINMKPLMQVSNKTNYYIGISKQTPKEIADAWQIAFDALNNRGEVKRILERWLK